MSQHYRMVKDHASLQIDLGGNIKYLQAQMRQSPVNITVDINGHLLEEENREAATRIGAAIFNNGHKVVTKQKRLTST